MTIPARHHGLPNLNLKLKLPELSQLADKGLPEEVVAIIKNNPAPWLIFAPTIPLVKQITKHLTEVLDGQSAAVGQQTLSRPEKGRVCFRQISSNGCNLNYGKGDYHR